MSEHLRVVARERGLHRLVTRARSRDLRGRRSSAGTVSAASRRRPRPCRSCASARSARGVEAAVDVDLLVRGGAVAAVVLGGLVRAPPPCRSGSGWRACRRRSRRRRWWRRSSTSACVSSSMKVGELESHDVLGADAVQELRLLGAAHDVDQARCRPPGRSCSASGRGWRRPRYAPAPCGPRASWSRSCRARSAD